MTLPGWLILALTSPAFWAIVHVLDSYCVDRVFHRPWIGLVASSLTMLISLPLLIGGVGFVGWSPLSATAMAWCGLAGFSFMASQLLYFYALSQSESGIVAAYWNLLPLFLLLAGYVILDERFSAARYAGCLILVICSVSFCVVDGNVEHRVRSFWMMLVAALFQLFYFHAQKHVFATHPVYPVFVAMTVAMIFSGLLPLLRSQCRREFLVNWPQIRSWLPFLLLIEAANLIAV